MSEYQQTEIVDRPADEVFAWVSAVNNLPKYLPPVKEAGTEGPAEASKPGQKVRLRVEIPDRYETEGEGYFAVDEGERRMEWGRRWVGTTRGGSRSPLELTGGAR